MHDFPFFIGLLDEHNLYDSYGLPSKLPISLSYDSNKKLIVQNYSKNINHYLEKSYLIGSNISANLGSGSFGKRRANDVLKYLKLALKEEISDKSFLEVGCADGYILNQLSLMGAKKILGCEPNQSNLNKIKKNNVKIISDFYTPEIVNEKFDVILSLGVLEHIHEPGKFIKSQLKSLNQDGLIFFSVPNCEKKLMLGDLKIIQHEHWNYFTRDSIKHLLQNNGLTDIELEISQNNANIFVWGRFSESGGIIYDNPQHDGQQVFKIFSDKLNLSNEIMIDRAKDILNKGKTIGFMSGGLELMSIIPFIENPRFFDNDTSKHGKYYPGFTNAIESPKNLISNPCDELWICATDYNDEIIQGLKTIISNQTKIWSIRDMLLKIHS